MTALQGDYGDRVYAGVLGKIIGVYLGRPFEGWRHRRIMGELGEITYYVNDRRDVQLKNTRLVVTDDDITGTFTFPRAMRDYPLSQLDPVHVGMTWLNYIIEGRTVLWWGGRGNSTEHTAYLLLREGIPPPASGSIARNGRVVAEQIGAEIFVDAWGLACPGDPERAADLAERAASVSHDGEALSGARVVAALIAQAFAEPRIDRLLDTAVTLIPRDSLIRRVIDDVREWHATGEDWKAGFARIDERYGYERYGGNCHVVPNHAILVHSLVHGRGDFTRSLQILMSCGWDTDSNGGNVGCITGVRGGLPGIDAGPDWRGPVADRMYLPTADAGETITDAAREAVVVMGYAHALRRLPFDPPKDGARFHFSFPGSAQGFHAEPETAHIANVVAPRGERALALHHAGAAVRAMTPTFLTPDTVEIPPYGMVACPTLYAGQTVRARVIGGTAETTCRLVARVYGAGDRTQDIRGPDSRAAADALTELVWRVPDTGGQPVAAIGLEVVPAGSAESTVYLDRLTWDGTPELALSRPADGGTMWRHAWASAVDSFDPRWPEPFRMVQNRGTGLLIHGTRDWRDYEVVADVTPHLARAVGLAARVTGLHRYYAIRLVDRTAVQLVRVLDEDTVLAERPFAWEYGTTYELRLSVAGERIRAAVDAVALEATDDSHGMSGGGIALMVEEGRSATSVVRIGPVSAISDGIAAQEITQGGTR